MLRAFLSGRVARADLDDLHQDVWRDEAELAGWLERLVVGERLGAPVAELEGIHRPAPRTASLDQALGDRREAVLRDGLASLPHDRFGLRQPRLLPKLQEQVLVSGGPYWETLAAAQPDHRDALSRGRVRLPGLPNVPGQALAARGAARARRGAPRRWRHPCAGAWASRPPPRPRILLTADDRAWLVERRRAWVAKLDAHLASLESGATRGDHPRPG